MSYIPFGSSLNWPGKRCFMCFSKNCNFIIPRVYGTWFWHFGDLFEFLNVFFSSLSHFNFWLFTFSPLISSKQKKLCVAFAISWWYKAIARITWRINNTYILHERTSLCIQVIRNRCVARMHTQLMSSKESEMCFKFDPRTSQIFLNSIFVLIALLFPWWVRPLLAKSSKPFLLHKNTGQLYDDEFRQQIFICGRRGKRY